LVYRFSSGSGFNVFQIASQFSAYAQKGKRIALANPVGLYIHSIESDKFRVAGGSEPLNWSQVWTVERGADRAVRAKFKVPKKLVGRIRVNGRKLEYGSQIAQYLWVAVHAVVTDALRPQVTALQPIYSFIEGRHIKPVKLADDVVSELQSEPFGDYLATTEYKDRAITLDKLLGTFDAHTWVSYAADEGIGFTFNTPRDKVRVRLVILCTPGYASPPRDRRASKMADITRFKQRAFKVPTLAVVAVPPSDNPNDYNSSRSILQIASFNPDVGWFNFYDVSPPPPQLRFIMSTAAKFWTCRGNVERVVQVVGSTLGIPKMPSRRIPKALAPSAATPMAAWS
jgi:hypothetical protein